MIATVQQFEQATPFIQAALDEEGTGLYSLRDVLDDLLMDRALLWSNTRAAIVTRMRQMPRGKSLLLWLGGGDLDALVDLAVSKVRPYAQSEGASVIEINGRPGWARALKRRGLDARVSSHVIVFNV